MDQCSQDRWKSPIGLIYWIFQNLQAPYLEMLKDALRIFSFSKKTESTLHSLGWIQKPLVWRLAMLQLASNQWWWSGYSKSPFGPVNHNQFKIKALLVSIRFLTVCTAGCTSQNMSRCGEISEKRITGIQCQHQKFRQSKYTWQKPKPYCYNLSSGKQIICHLSYLHIIKGENLVNQFPEKKVLKPYPMETACCGCASMNTPATSTELHLNEAQTPS